VAGKRNDRKRLQRIADRVERLAREAFEGERGSHDFGHVERVLLLCERIRRAEGGDPDVLRLAALLHDLGRTDRHHGKGSGGHAARGARLARKILRRHEVDEPTIDAVVRCIATHSFRARLRPETIEAKVLFDADKLDSIGAIGVGRAFLFAGEIGAKAHNAPGTNVEHTRAYSREDTAYREYLVKLRFLRDGMTTREGRRLAADRHRYMQAFFRRLAREADGRA
jgi:uncharacterized protein